MRLVASLRVKLRQRDKVPPAKVLVIGAGVAGLAAIGAANSFRGDCCVRLTHALK